MNETDTKQITVDLWTDIVCPWCYVGEGRLEEAIRAEGLEGRVRIRVHSFELDPNAPEYRISASGQGSAKTNIDHLRAKFGREESEVRKMEEQIASLATEIGREYSVERPVANTRRIHRVAQALQEQGTAAEFFFSLQRDYFTGVSNPFDDTTILDAAERAGLDRETAVAVLQDPDRHDDDVDRDVMRAQSMGATGVPFSVFDARYAAPGALPVDAYRQILRQLASEQSAETAEDAPAGSEEA